jgi:hypothetical protein
MCLTWHSITEKSSSSIYSKFISSSIQVSNVLVLAVRSYNHLRTECKERMWGIIQSCRCLRYLVHIRTAVRTLLKWLDMLSMSFSLLAWILRWGRKLSEKLLDSCALCSRTGQIASWASRWGHEAISLSPPSPLLKRSLRRLVRPAVGTRGFKQKTVPSPLWLIVYMTCC